MKSDTKRVVITPEVIDEPMDEDIKFDGSLSISTDLEMDDIETRDAYGSITPKMAIAKLRKISRPSTKAIFDTFDLDGDGKLSLDEIMLVAETLKHSDRREKRYKITIVLLVIMVILLIWAVFGVSYLAATLAQPHAVSNGKLTGKDGKGALMTGTGPVMYGGSTTSSNEAVMLTPFCDVQHDVNNDAGSVDEGAQDLNEGDGNIGDGKGDLDEGQGSVGDGKGDLDEGQGSVGDGTGDLDEGQESVGDGKGDLDEGQGNAGDDQGNVDEGDGDINQGDGDVNQDEGAIGGNEGNIDEGDGDIGQGQGGINQGDGAVGEDGGKGDANGDDGAVGEGEGAVGEGQGAAGEGQGAVGEGEGAVGEGEGAVGEGEGAAGEGQGAVDEGQESVGEGSTGVLMLERKAGEAATLYNEPSDLFDTACNNEGASIDLKSVVQVSMRSLLQRGHQPKASHAIEHFAKLSTLLQDGDDGVTIGDSRTLHVSVNTVDVPCAVTRQLENKLDGLGENFIYYEGTTSLCIEPQYDGSPQAVTCHSTVKFEVTGIWEDLDGNTVFAVRNHQNELPSFDDVFLFICPKFWQKSDCSCSLRIGVTLTLKSLEYLIAMSLEVPGGQEALANLMQLAVEDDEEGEDDENFKSDIEESLSLLTFLPEAIECYDRATLWGRGLWDPFTACSTIASKVDDFEACYSADSTVVVQTDSYPAGVKRKISDIHPGDRVMSFDDQGEVSFQEIYYIGHASEISGKDESTTFLRLHHTSVEPAGAHYIDITPYHLIYLSKPYDASVVKSGYSHCIQIQKQQVCTNYAKSADVGDTVWFYDSTVGQFKPVEITDITTTQNKFRTPMTLNGNIVVNNLAGSSYTIDHDTFHMLTTPLRTLYKIYPQFTNSLVCEHLITFSASVIGIFIPFVTTTSCTSLFVALVMILAAFVSRI